MALLQKNITANIKTYINSIKPGEFLQVGNLNKIGITEQNVDYFNVVSLIIDNEEVKDIAVIQEIDTKMLFQSIEWLTEG